jgi:hypothetical protein
MTVYTSTFKYALISARSIPSAVCAATPEDEQVMLETCKKGKGRPITGRQEPRGEIEI